MNILMVLRSVKAGGAEKHVLQLSHALRAAGHVVHYAGPRHGWLGQEFELAHFPVLDLPMRGTYDLLSAWRLSRYAQKVRADVIHGHLTRGAFYSGWASRLSGIPNIATAHADNAGKHFGQAHHLIAVSHAVKRFLVNCGYPAQRISVVHHGIPDPQTPSISHAIARQQLQLQPHVPCLLMVARIVPAKGHDTALHALAQLQHLPWKLLIAGNHLQDLGPDMQALCVRLGLHERVQFLGLRTDVPLLMQAADLLLAPSRREALSLTLIEAAACRLSAVASRVGGIPEVIEPGKTGWLVEPDNPQALAHAIEEALQNPAQRTTMGQAARQKFETSFTLQAMLDNTLRVYAQVLSGELT